MLTSTPVSVSTGVDVQPRFAEEKAFGSPPEQILITVELFNGSDNGAALRRVLHFETDDCLEHVTARMQVIRHTSDGVIAFERRYLLFVGTDVPARSSCDTAVLLFTDVAESTDLAFARLNGSQAVHDEAIEHDEVMRYVHHTQHSCCP